MYPSSINRALCSDGMRCIKPLAPSRNETNSSRVNVGADWAILGICASGAWDQETSPHTPACQPSQDSFSVLGPCPTVFRAKTHQRACLSHGGSFSFSGRECKAPVVSAGSSPGPRYRFSPYTAPHDNNTLRISAPAVAMTISRLPDLSVNAAPLVLHPKRAYRG